MDIIEIKGIKYQLVPFGVEDVNPKDLDVTCIYECSSPSGTIEFSVSLDNEGNIMEGCAAVTYTNKEGEKDYWDNHKWVLDTLNGVNDVELLELLSISEFNELKHVLTKAESLGWLK